MKNRGQHWRGGVVVEIDHRGDFSPGVRIRASRVDPTLKSHSAVGRGGSTAGSARTDYKQAEMATRFEAAEMP